ncbi:MAG: hypothetical protein ACRDOC_11810 [Streptosporangiaceae bacterium]
MTPASHDDVRAAAALLACTARARSLQPVVLGADPDRGAVIACVLADWLAQVLRDTGIDPREFALRVIGDSIADEAEEAG